MAATLWRHARYKGYSVTASADLTKFCSNCEVSTLAEKAMSWAKANELLNSKGSGILDPKGNAERDQVAVILYQLMENVVK